MSDMGVSRQQQPLGPEGAGAPAAPSVPTSPASPAATQARGAFRGEKPETLSRLSPTTSSSKIPSIKTLVVRLKGFIDTIVTNY